MTALVIGCGKSGMAARKLLSHKGVKVDMADNVDFVVASPGVRVMSELEYGVRELARLGVKMIAVTGSKGKSSVVKLVADALGGMPCGNYGLPVSDLASQLSAPGSQLRTSLKWAVVEVSSFMMETTNLPPDVFEAAAILNLQEDHLDRHGSKELYHALKRKLLFSAKAAFDCTAPDAGDLLKGSYFDNGVLRVNGAVAASLMRAAGLDAAQIRKAFLDFRPLPHRMETVGTFGGVRVVDDSKSTSMASLAAGVDMVGGRVRLIAGGLAKGDDPKSVIPLLTRRVEKVYLIGDCADALAASWDGSTDIQICRTLERAVAAAMREAEEGDTILLSPGAASFDQFKNFRERGDVFASLAKQEGKNK